MKGSFLKKMLVVAISGLVLFSVGANAGTHKCSDGKTWNPKTHKCEPTKARAHP